MVCGRLFPDLQRTAGDTNLYEIDTHNGVAKALTTGGGVRRARAFSSDAKTVAYIFEDHMSPRDIYVSDISLSNPVRLTDSNPWIREERTISPGELLQWEGKDGMLIEGLYYPPVRQGRSSGLDPLIVFIHGGPPAAWEANFREDFQMNILCSGIFQAVKRFCRHCGAKSATANSST